MRASSSRRRRIRRRRSWLINRAIRRCSSRTRSSAARRAASRSARCWAASRSARAACPDASRADARAREASRARARRPTGRLTISPLDAAPWLATASSSCGRPPSASVSAVAGSSRPGAAVAGGVSRVISASDPTGTSDRAGSSDSAGARIPSGCEEFCGAESEDGPSARSGRTGAATAVGFRRDAPAAAGLRPTSRPADHRTRPSSRAPASHSALTRAANPPVADGACSWWPGGADASMSTSDPAGCEGLPGCIGRRGSIDAGKPTAGGGVTSPGADGWLPWCIASRRSVARRTAAPPACLAAAIAPAASRPVVQPARPSPRLPADHSAPSVPVTVDRAALS